MLRSLTAVSCIIGVVLLLGCTEQNASRARQTPAELRNEEQRSPDMPPWFEDATATLGLNFKHRSGAAGNYFMPESIGSGGVLLDFDNDGRLDIYLIHHAQPSSKVRNRLYHQEGDGRFRDVTEGSGLDVTGSAWAPPLAT